MTMKMREAGRSSDPMRAEASLSLKKAAVDRELGRLLRGRGSTVHRAMRYAVIPGGKRFRPLLLMASGACFGARRSVLLPFACALELIHSYSLVHDDLPAMDNDDFRRGRPSCHKAFGEGVALLAGDGLLTLAFEAMAAARVPAALLAAKQEAMLVVSRSAGADGMIGGQWLDISLPPEKLTRRALDAVNSKKTGSLIQCAVESGALLGRAGAADRRAMADYGRNLGLAFQIRDDIMDAGGEADGGRPRRPDHTALYGLAGSRARLARLVGEAVKSIDRFQERGTELRHLALSLLDIDAQAKNA
jgi:geranylgeranyl pyrophosphate synthase